MTARRLLAVAALFGAVGVALGAFGAHGLKDRLTAPDLAVFETAVRYQMYHAVALLGLSAWIERTPAPRLLWAAGAWIAGTTIFSGSLYLLVLTDTPWLGAVAPLGGVALIAGWLLVASQALTQG